jgi:hypothetical protein
MDLRQGKYGKLSRDDSGVDGYISKNIPGKYYEHQL